MGAAVVHRLANPDGAMAERSGSSNFPLLDRATASGRFVHVEDAGKRLETKRRLVIVAGADFELSLIS
jgi:hypothetical protein